MRLEPLRRLFPSLRPGADARRQVDDELEFHLERRTLEFEAQGFDRAVARAMALRRFGDLDQARRELAAGRVALVRRQSRVDWLADLWRDISLAARGLVRDRAFAVMAVATFAVGLGATSAMLSVVDRLLLHPLPYPDAERLVSVWLHSGSAEHSLRIDPTPGQIRIWRAQARSVARIEAHESEEIVLDENGGPELAPARRVTPGLLPALGGFVLAGRELGRADAEPGAPRVALLSWGAWQRRFGGRADVIGRQVTLDGALTTVVGVMRRGFDLVFLDHQPRAEFWLPLNVDSASRAAVVVWVKPGTTIESVNQDLARTLETAAAADRAPEQFRVRAIPAGDLAERDLRRTLLLLLGAAGLVLVVAATNVAGLLVARSAGRVREFAVRTALGAGRARVVRQLLTESVLVGLLGGGLGLAIAALLLGLVRTLRPQYLLTLDDARLNPMVLAVGLALAIGSSLLAGLAPLWTQSRHDAALMLLGRTRRPGDGRRVGRLRSALVAGELAASVVLLVGAGLLVKSFLKERDLPLGFDAANLAQVSYTLPEQRFKTAEERAALERQILDRVRATPGVVRATVADNSPIGMGVMMAEFLVEGRALPPREEHLVFPLVSVRPEYFAVVGARILEGRTFDQDVKTSEILVDEQTARRLWPGGGAVGARVRFGRDEEPRTIVGVVETQRILAASFSGVPFVFARVQDGRTGSTVMARLAREDHGANAVAAAVRAIDPNIRIRGIQTAQGALGERLSMQRFTTLLLLGFAAVALSLAAIGLYGVVAYLVEQRRYEIGVRLALGATPHRIVRLMVVSGVGRILLGLSLGMAGALGAVRLLRGLLYQVEPFDPVMFTVAALVLAIVSLGATWWPARRASRVDPTVVMRSDS